MEDTRKHKLLRGVASLLFGCAACLFWGHCYPHHLHYQEQLQLFLFTPEYWADKMGHPGGVAEYLAEFLTQFYYHAWAGATIVAVALVIIQRQVWCLARLRGAAAFVYPLSFLPSLCLWVFLCDENALLSIVISIMLSFFASMLYTALPREGSSIRTAYGLLMTPFLYWVAGPCYILFVIHLLTADHTLLQGKYTKIGSIFLCLLCPLVALYLTQYPPLSLVTGINYYRFPEITPGILILSILVPAVTPWLLTLRSKAVNNTKPIMAIEAGILILCGGAWIYAAADPGKEEVLKYDYLTRMKRWNQIIREAEKKEPRSPLAVTCLNLALAKTGQLGDRMFHFYQNGTEGLIPAFQRDFTSPLPASEIFYHLGMINSSQRYTFEAMEAIPDYKKSGRAYVRLAETNLINGQYAVAAKYLRVLRHTIFYRRWANEVMTYLGNEDKIARHPEWGRLRQLRYADDFLFSEAEMESMLGLLLQHNKTNRLAFEYLLAYTLQKKDLESFTQYYPLGKDLGYNQIPISYQEALIFIWTQQHPNFQGLPWSISRSVMEGVSEFARVYMTQKDSEPILRPKYEKTFWYYLLFRK